MSAEWWGLAALVAAFLCSGEALRGTYFGMRIVTTALWLGALCCLAGPATALATSPELALGVEAESEHIVTHDTPSLTFDGKHFVALWRADRIELNPARAALPLLTRIDVDGRVLDPHGIVAPGALQIAGAPWGTLVVSLTVDGVSLRRLSRDGTWLDAPQLLDTGSLNANHDLQAACGARSCLVTWNGQDTRRGQILDDCGEAVGEGLVLPPGKWELAPKKTGFVALRYHRPETATVELTYLHGIADNGEALWTSPALDAPARAAQLAVAGRDTVLFWSQRGEEEGFATHVQRVNDRGRAEPVQVVRTPGEFSVGSVAWEGDHFRMILNATGQFHQVLLSPSGEIQESMPLELPVAPGCTLSTPRLWAAPDATLLMWRGSNNSSTCQFPAETAAIFDPVQSTPGTPFRVVGAGARMGPAAVVAGEDEYLLAWAEERLGASGLYTQRLTAAGSPIDEPRLTIPMTPHPAEARRANAFFMGDGYTVRLGALLPMWSEWQEPAVAIVLDAQGEPISDAVSEAVVGTAGRETFLVHQLDVSAGEDRPTLMHLGIKIADATGTQLADEPVWYNPLTVLRDDSNGDASPVSAFDGSSFGLVWWHFTMVAADPEDCPDDLVCSSNTRVSDLLYMAFDPQGAPAWEVPITLPGLGNFTPLQMVHGAGAYLLLLQGSTEASTNELWAIRISAAGELLDSAPVLLRAGEPERPSLPPQPQATFDGSRFLVAYHAYEHPERAVVDRGSVDIRLAPLSAELQLRSDQPVAAGPESEALGALASLGDGTSVLTYHRFEPTGAVIQRSYMKLLGSGPCEQLAECGESCPDGCCKTGCPATASGEQCTPEENIEAPENPNWGELDDLGADAGAPDSDGADAGAVEDSPTPCSGPQCDEHDAPNLRAVSGASDPGCGCRIPTQQRDSSWPRLAALAAVALLGRRRPRRAGG